MMHLFNVGYPMMRMGCGWIMGIAVALVIILIVFLVVRSSQHHQSSCQPSVSKNAAVYESTAMKILNERYAKGEIGDEEYQNKKANLK